MLWNIVIIIPITGFFVKKTIDYFYPNKINEIIKKKSLKYSWIVLEKVSRCEIYISKLLLLRKLRPNLVHNNAIFLSLKTDSIIAISLKPITFEESVMPLK